MVEILLTPCVTQQVLRLEDIYHRTNTTQQSVVVSLRMSADRTSIEVVDPGDRGSAQSGIRHRDVWSCMHHMLVSVVGRVWLRGDAQVVERSLWEKGASDAGRVFLHQRGHCGDAD